MKKRLNNRYFILRHGQNTHQKRNQKRKKPKIYYWPDSPPARLTKKGKRQIKIAAGKLKKQRISFEIGLELRINIL